MGILSLRINDNHIRIRRKNDVLNLSLCCKRLTTTGYTEDKGITIQKLLTVSNNHIFADDILPIINTVLIVNILNSKRHEYCKALCSKCSERVNLSCAIRHNCIQTIHLLILQHRKLTQMFSCCRKQCFCIVIKLLFRICCMHHRKHCEHHSLVTSCQVVKELLHFFFLLFHIIRNGRRKVIVLILLSLAICDICFHTEQSVLCFSYRFICWHRHNVNGHHQIPIHIRKLCNHLLQVFLEYD